MISFCKISMISRLVLAKVRKIRQQWWLARIRRFRKRYVSRAVSLRYCSNLRQRAATILGVENALTPLNEEIIGRGEWLRDMELAKLFRGVELGGMPLPVDTIDWLVAFLFREKPRIVLEFGSGVSTVCLCNILHRIYGRDGFRLLSMEQDPNEVLKTEAKLRGLDGCISCRIVHVPLVPAVVKGQPTHFYDIGGMSKEHFHWLRRAEFILIDGPFAEGPCRYGTITQVRTYLKPGAHFLMDDALRAKELLAGSLWMEEGIRVDGVLTVGRGIMIGTVP